VPPTFVRITRRALKGWPTEPSNAFSVTTQGYVVTSGRRERPSRRCQSCAAIPVAVAPRRVLQRHPRCCWSARGQDVAIPAAVPRTGPLGQPPQAGPRTTAGEPTATPPPSKLLLFGHRTRHDATTGTRFARTDVNSLALLAMPPHVGE
jgi:hypothetical protein